MESGINPQVLTKTLTKSQKLKINSLKKNKSRPVSTVFIVIK